LGRKFKNVKKILSKCFVQSLTHFNSYADDFYAPVLQEAFNESEQMDHLTVLFLVNELIDLHNRHILNTSAAKPIHFTDPSLKAQSAIQMLTKICPTPGYASLLQHVLTHETVVARIPVMSGMCS
jgi:hypothetical protein